MTTVSSASDTATREPLLFPALLRFWRQRRGFTQAALAEAVGVSTRHISFLETGRSGPSREVVILLANALDLAMRDTNQLLRGASFAVLYSEPGPEEVLNGPVGHAVETAFRHHEPFPMGLFDRLSNVVRINQAGARLVGLLFPDGLADLNLTTIVFGADPDTGIVANWSEVSRSLLQRTGRQALERPTDHELQRHWAQLRDHERVPDDWHLPSLEVGSELPVLPLELRLPDDRRLCFITTISTFNAPLDVTLSELYLESFLPADEATAALCHELLAD